MPQDAEVEHAADDATDVEPSTSPAEAQERPIGPRRHEHSIAQRSRWPWLPTQNCGHLAAHPFCPDCGEVKAVGTGRALDAGGLVNLIADLKRLIERDGYTLTAVQRRLILKKVKEEALDDAFTLTRDRQLTLLAKIVSTYTSLPESQADTYLRSC